MQFKHVSTEGLLNKFEVTVPWTEVQQEQAKKLQEIQAKVKMEGFRPGKAPLQMILKRYGQETMREALEKVVTDSARNVIANHGIKNHLQPEIDLQEVKAGEDIIYNLNVEAMPSVELKDFAEISLEKINVSIEDKDVTHSIEHFCADNPYYGLLSSPRAIKEDDRVKVRLTIAGEKPEEFYVLTNDTNSILAPLVQQLVGKNDKEIISHEIAFPEDLPAKKFAGKSKECSFEILEISEKQPWVFDADQLKYLDCESEEEFKDRIKKSLEDNFSRFSRLYNKRFLLDAFNTQYDFALPASMVKNEFERIWEKLQEELKENPEVSENKSEDELRAEYQSIAERRVRLGLLISEISSKHNIRLTENEVRNAVEAELRKYNPQDANEIVTYLNKNPGAVNNMVAPALEEKVVDFVLTKITSHDKMVSIDEFKKISKDVIPVVWDDHEHCEHGKDHDHEQEKEMHDE